jgi:hypothetical protein
MADRDTHENGEVYALGPRVMIAPKQSEKGWTMGGPLATAENETIAFEMARRCQAHDGLLKAAQEALEWIDQRSAGLVLDVKDSLRAAIRQAGGAA